MKTQTIILSGLTCQACKKITEKRIGGIHGVHTVEVTVESGTAVICAEREIMKSEIDDALKDTQYKVIA